MGTRADFYIGKGPNAIWIGSVTHDGYPYGVMSVLRAKSEKSFKRRFKELKEEYNYPETIVYKEEGWPWPWKTSITTDYSYYWIKKEKKVLAWSQSKRLFDPLKGDYYQYKKGIYLKDWYEKYKNYEDYPHSIRQIIGCGGLLNPSNITTGGFILLKVSA